MSLPQADLKLQFQWCDGVWVAPIQTPYGVLEVMVGGTEEAPAESHLAAIAPFLSHASEITKSAKKRLRFSFLYRLIRIAVNEHGQVGLQFRNRITGAQPLFFPDERRRA
jgi:hypothetical protein